MAKATVLRCDKCSAWDAVGCVVRAVNVCGPRFELCPECRVTLLVTAGVEEDKARAFVKISDERGPQRGQQASLKHILALGERQATAESENGDTPDASASGEDEAQPGPPAPPENAPVVPEEPLEVAAGETDTGTKREPARRTAKTR